MLFTKTRSLFAGLLAFSLFLAACGSDGDLPTGTHIRLASEPTGLNPILTFDGVSLQIASHIFQPLLDFDPETLIEEPVLAKNKAVLSTIDTGVHKGLVRLSYEIRDDAKWDNGTPVTGNDYLFTIKAIRVPQVKATTARGYTEHIKEIVVNAQDPKKFDIIVTPYCLSESSCNNMPIMPAHHYDAKGDLQHVSLAQLSDAKTTDILLKDSLLVRFAEQFQSPERLRSPEQIQGSGPYKMIKWDTDQQIVLTRKENWWGSGKKGALFASKLDQIWYNIVKDGQTALNMVKDGQLDVVSRVPPAVFVQMREDLAVKDKLQFLNAPTLEVSYLGFNTKVAKLQDVNVRRAIAHLTDVTSIINNIYRGLAKPAVGPIHASKGYYNSSLPQIAYDPAKAIALLDAAGWKDSDGNGVREKVIGGKKTELKIRFAIASTNEVARNIVLLMQENAKQAGVAFEILPTEPERYREILSKRDFDMFAASMATDLAPDDPKQYWHTKSDTPDGSNRFGFGNAQTDALIDSLRTNLDTESRKAMYMSFQQAVYDAQPAIFICTPLERLVVGKNIGLQTTLKRPGFIEATLSNK